ncbi:MAG: crossover junction endodeoxyribonuclease RuvC [Polyangiales bacterium]
MRILGIDPGTIRTGWGLVEARGSKLVFIAAGTSKANASAPLAERLRIIDIDIRRCIAEFSPTAMAVEDIFFAKHPNAALKLGHARGVALLAAAVHELEVFEYPPTLVKRTIVGKGRADKSQVGQMVTRMLGLSELPQTDAADALAIAITHLLAARSREQMLKAR